MSVSRVAVVGASQSFNGAAQSLPTHADKDRIILVLGGKYDDTSLPTIGGTSGSGWVLLGTATGGTGTPGADVGKSFLFVYGLDCTSSAMGNVSFTAGGTGPNSSTFFMVTFRPSSGKVFKDALGASAPWVLFTDDTNTASPLTGTSAAFAGQPEAGDALFCVGAVPSDSGVISGTTSSITATGLSGGTVTFMDFVESGTGDDSAQVGSEWLGFTGTATSGVTATHTVASLSNHSGPIAYIALREGVPGPNVPTSVSSPSQTTTTADLQWSAPSGGGTVTHYEVRIDGGTPSTQSSPYTFTGLTPATMYTLEVRAVGPGGNSAWVAVTPTTDADPAPNVPTSVAATSTVYAIALTWSAPSGGGTVTSYEVRIDGGTPVTATSPHDFTGLTPDTSYTVEVRAVGPGGSSAWVAVVASTGVAGAWRTEVVIGPHTWTIDRDDVADPDVPNILAGMSIGWKTPTRSTYDWRGQPAPVGVFTFQPPHADPESGWPAQPEPWIAGIRILTDTAAETSDLDVGDKVWIRFYPDGPGEALLVTFAGRIREVTQDPVERQSEDTTPRTITTVRAVDYTLDLTDIPVDLTVTDLFEGWPSGVDGSTQVDRWEQAAEYSGVPAVSDPPDYPEPLRTGQMVGGPGSGTAYTVLRSVAQATSAMLKANVDTSGDLDPDHPWVFDLWRPNIADGLVRQYVYTDGLTIEGGDITGGGIPAVDVPISLLSWARDTISPGFENGGPYGFPLDGAWTANGLRYIGMDARRVARWFILPEAMSTLVGISGLATYRNPRGVSYHSGRLSSATLIVGGAGDWVVDFSLIRTLPDAVITWEDTITWDEMPSDITWDDMDPGLTWGDMATVTEAD